MIIECIYLVIIVNKNELNFDHVCYHKFHMELSIFGVLHLSNLKMLVLKYTVNVL